MTIPKLISNKHGRCIPMTELQEQFFDDNGADSLLDEDIEIGLDETFDNEGAPF